MKRGEIWMVNLNPAQGSEINKIRPAVIVTLDPLNAARRTVVVVPLSSSPSPRPPLVVPMPSAGENSVAVCDQIRAVDKSRLSRKIDHASEEDMTTLASALKIILGL